MLLSHTDGSIGIFFGMYKAYKGRLGENAISNCEDQTVKIKL